MGGFSHVLGRGLRDLGGAAARVGRSARRGLELGFENQSAKAALPGRNLLAGLLGEEPIYGFERLPSGILQSQQPGYEPVPEADARAMVARALGGPMQGDVGEKTSGQDVDLDLREGEYGFERLPSGALESRQPGESIPQAEHLQMIARALKDLETSPAEREMEEAFQRYQENPEAYAAETYKRPMFPGELRVGLGGEESLRTYNPSAGLGKEFAATRGRGFGQEWTPSAGPGAGGTVTTGAATPLARPELQGGSDAVERVAREERHQAVIDALKGDLEEQRTRRSLEREAPLGSELPTLTGGEALQMQMRAAAQSAQEQRKQMAFAKLQASVAQLEDARRRGIANPNDPRGITPEQYQNAHDALRFLYAAEIGDPRFLATKPREDFGIVPGAPQ